MSPDFLLRFWWTRVKIAFANRGIFYEQMLFCGFFLRGQSLLGCDVLSGFRRSLRVLTWLLFRTNVVKRELRQRWSQSVYVPTPTSGYWPKEWDLHDSIHRFAHIQNEIGIAQLFLWSETSPSRSLIWSGCFLDASLWKYCGHKWGETLGQTPGGITDIPSGLGMLPGAPGRAEECGWGGRHLRPVP